MMGRCTQDDVVFVGCCYYYCYCCYLCCYSLDRYYWKMLDPWLRMLFILFMRPVRIPIVRDNADLDTYEMDIHTYFIEFQIFKNKKFVEID